MTRSFRHEQRGNGANLWRDAPIVDWLQTTREALAIAPMISARIGSSVTLALSVTLRRRHTRPMMLTASGASAVAIDNKIEQAMDLVKSHLMFAVREEVEVLKDKIAELMDRINQLELENSILKAHATQETLEQLVAGKAVMDVPPAAAPEQQNGIATP
ncbi:protein bunched, class 1/class 3/D/E isoforms-like isoform X1 [Thrips palmi]|uniref:Protein bunched, class 1/class 3/D/E isoforms-like isoform X1 n=1 Tax=Thrips palmi TaxID=161013 RepID=A0A6P8ZT89_THRPL|nr:protein bunched, class 1/class 3/D/E isoforms-like isoform X1 [Thrips palmi]